MHLDFLKSLIAHMENVINHFEATRGIGHAYQKGAAREALARTAIEPWFGPSVAIGSGFVINAINNPSDQRGLTSTECDNVIYWPDLMPKLTLGLTDGPSLFPIEGVAAVVEVKSNLTKKELEETLKKLPTAVRVNMCSGFPRDIESGQHMGGIPITFPFGCLLAFQSEVAQSTLVEILENNLNNWDIVCVLGDNGGVFYIEDTIVKRQMFTVQFPDDSSPPILLGDFSVLLRDKIQMLHLERVRQAPSLRPYISIVNLPQPQMGG